MNVVFISPQFPEVYWHFCYCLRRRGATVLGIGDTPYDQISPELKGSLNEYYWLPSLEDYNQVFRAVAFFSYKYGKIDWLESNNEYWLKQDAKLRDDFHITTGAGSAQMAIWQSKAAMKPLYAAAGVPSARQVRLTSLAEARTFVEKVGYPAFAKPEFGMGAGGAHKIESDDDLVALFDEVGTTPYVLEEFVSGDLCSYDAIIDSHGEPMFENQEEFPPSMADVASLGLDMSYLSRPTVDPKLAKCGRATVKSFGIKSRFVHQEYFRLTEDKPGLGAAGDYVGLEVNVRPPGGYTPEMMNYAHATDVYQIWADMVCFDRTDVRPGGTDAFCSYASRRDGVRYVHTHEEILSRYAGSIVSAQRMPDGLADDLGNYCYVARLNTQEEVEEFVSYVCTREA